MNMNLRRVIRLDSLPYGQTLYTEEGYLVDHPILTSVGIFEYMNDDGSIRRELRLPEEVFAEESLASYKGKPIIVTHNAGLIDKNNVHEESIGTILSEGYRNGDDVRAEIVIHDTKEMKSSGYKELSLGYNLDLDETPGEWNGEKYDAIQRNIRINHLALVKEARAGDQARLNIDSRDSNKILKGGKAMSAKTKKNAKRSDEKLSDEALEQAIADYKARRAERTAKTDEDAPKSEEMTDKVTPNTDEGEEEAATVEEQVQEVKDRRDRRDEEDEPKDVKEAEGVIARQDEDIDMLFNIIDTLLAERDFAKKDSDDTVLEGSNEDEDEIEAVTEEEAVAEDEDEFIPEEEPADETAEDEDDTDVIAEDECEDTMKNDEDEPETKPLNKMNADSIDKLVRQRIQLGMIGRTLNMDGLENMPITKAKKKVIKKLRPGLRLDGKSNSYIDAAFELAIEEAKSTKKTTAHQISQMFNSANRADSKDEMSGSFAARQRMINKITKKEGK